MSDGSNGLEARVDALEARLAYQDETIEALNKTITEQWAIVQAIRRRLADTIERLEEQVAGDVPVERPPPHY